MKKSLIFCIVFNCCTIGVYAQVCTPIGTSVDYHNDSVGTPDEIAGWEADTADWIEVHIEEGQYVEKIGNADGSYNCYGYAWHVEHNGNKDVVYAYLDSDLENFDREDSNATPPPPDNIEKYWDDGSYVQVQYQNQGQKAWYGTCWEWDDGENKWLD